MKIKDFLKSLKPKPCYEFTVYLKSGQSTVVSFIIGTELIESLVDNSNHKVTFKHDNIYSHFFNLADIESVVRREVEHNFGG